MVPDPNGHSDIKAMIAELQKIGTNINQIAKRVNATGEIYAQDIEDIKGGAKWDMAITKIHPIKSTLKKALDYITNPAKLKADYKRLTAEKDALYTEYGKLKKQLREYDAVKQNIDSILHPARGREQEKAL